jgi:hypothetical protein
LKLSSALAARCTPFQKTSLKKDSVSLQASKSTAETLENG